MRFEPPEGIRVKERRSEAPFFLSVENQPLRSCLRERVHGWWADWSATMTRLGIWEEFPPWIPRGR